MIVISLLYFFAFLITLCFLSKQIDLHFKRSEIKVKIFRGLLFGTFAIITLNDQIIPIHYLSINKAIIITSFSALFFGTLSGLISVSAAVIFEILNRDSNYILTSAVLLFSFTISLFFNRKWKKVSKDNFTPNNFLLFGFILQFTDVLLETVFSIIKATYYELNAELIIYPLITFLIGKIFSTQEQHNNVFIKIKESEEKFRKAFATNPDSININRLKDGLYISVNEGFLNLTGYNESEIIGKTSDEINIWKNYEDRKKLVKELQEKGTVINLEAQFIIKNGDVRYGSMSASLIELNNITHIISITRDITTRREIEHKLIESEKNYRQIINGMHDMVFVIDMKGKFIDVNSAAVNTLGYSREELLQLSPFDIDMSLSQQEIEDLILNMANLESQSFETEHLTKDKRTIPVEIKSTSIFYHGEKMILSISRDISQRKKAEESLQKRETLLNETQRLAKVGGWEWDIVNNSMYWTNECYRIHGLNFQENIPDFLIKQSINCYNPEDVDKVMSSFNKCVREGVPYDLEFQFNSYDGKVKWIRTNAQAVYNNNKIVKVVGNIIDITEKKITEMKITQLSIAVEQSPAMVIITNISGEIEYVNLKFSEISLYSFEDVLNKNISILNSESSANSDYSSIWRQIKSGETWKGTSLSKKKNGEIFWISSNISPLKNSEGKITQFVAILEDITKRIEYELQLEQYRENLEILVKKRTKEIEDINKELISEIEKKQQTELLLKQSLQKAKESSQLKSRFISTASHEFKTPLTKILSSAELMQRYGKNWSTDKYNEHFGRISNSVEYLSSLIDDVLTISKVDSNKIEFSPKELNIKKECESIISDFQYSGELKSNLIFNFIPEKTNFLVDPKQFHLIIQNLISNSIKYTSENKIIEVIINYVNDNIQIIIKDSGIGISETDLPHIFEPFYRSANNETIKGNGLGLSIVKNAVDLHGGMIQVNSKLGIGTTFVVQLPQ